MKEYVYEKIYKASMNRRMQPEDIKNVPLSELEVLWKATWSGRSYYIPKATFFYAPFTANVDYYKGHFTLDYGFESLFRMYHQKYFNTPMARRYKALHNEKSRFLDISEFWNKPMGSIYVKIRRVKIKPEYDSGWKDINIVEFIESYLKSHWIKIL